MFRYFRVKVLLLVVLAATAVACSNPKQPAPPATSNVYLGGAWTGPVTGTNFVATNPTYSLGFNVAYVVQQGQNNVQSTVPEATFAVNSSDGACWADGEGNVTITGHHFTSVTTISGTTSYPSSLSIVGDADDQGNMSGNISFSGQGCGSAANPWAGTFTAYRQ